MLKRHSLCLAALTTASLVVLPVIGAGAASAAPANGAATSTGNLLGTLAYRGAEHPYLVGMVADARKRFGPNSAQANAAQAGLTTNDKALAATLAGSSASIRKAVLGGLGLRDRIELSYAANVVAAKTAGTTATSAAEKQNITALASDASTIAATVHKIAPPISVSAAKKTFNTLDAGDLTALKAAALNQPSQFAAAEKGSLATAAAMIVFGTGEASHKSLGGTATTGSGSNAKVTVDKAALYRAALETAFTEHVYQTGLFGQAILLNGPRSAAAGAARVAENANTAFDARLLGDIGTGTAHTQAVWNTHITGYGDYLTDLYAGNATLTKPASTLLGSYETAITALVKKAAPALNTKALRASYTEHVTGTLAVFRLEKAGSASVYPMALMGAHHFSDLATTIAEAQTEIKSAVTS